jgi:hypothetical protein
LGGLLDGEIGDGVGAVARGRRYSQLSMFRSLRGRLGISKVG